MHSQKEFQIFTLSAQVTYTATTRTAVCPTLRFPNSVILTHEIPHVPAEFTKKISLYK